MKKMIALTLTAAIAVSACSVTAFADEQAPAVVQNDVVYTDPDPFIVEMSASAEDENGNACVGSELLVLLVVTIIKARRRIIFEFRLGFHLGGKSKFFAVQPKKIDKVRPVGHGAVTVEAAFLDNLFDKFLAVVAFLNVEPLMPR